MHHLHWTPQHRDSLLTRVTALTAGTAVVSAVGAVGIGVGLQAGTHYKAAAAKKQSAQAQPAPLNATPDASSPASPVAPTPDAGSPSASAPSSTAPAKPVSASKVHVVVYNATGTRGVAGAAASVLSAAGFHVDTIANYPGGRSSTSGIIYAPDQAGAARTLARATGITTGSPTGTSAPLVLVLGRDWLAAIGGTQWAPPQSAPQSAPQSGSGGSSNNGGGGSVVSSGGS